MPRAKNTLPILCDALEALAPVALAQDWDNVGLLLGDASWPAKKVLLCIDMMPAVVSEAIRIKADVVLAYHPPIFRPITRLVGPTDAMEAQVLRCASRQIAIYSPHTALDAAPAGPNAVLASLCGVDNARPLEAVREGTLPPETADAENWGMGRVGTIAPVELKSLATRLKRKTGAKCVSLVGHGTQTVKRVIVGVGAAGSMPFQLALTKSDVIVTGEIRHHDALRIRRVGCAAIALSHWSSERPVLTSLAEVIERRVPGVRAVVSKEDCEPFERA